MVKYWNKQSYNVTCVIWEFEKGLKHNIFHALILQVPKLDLGPVLAELRDQREVQHELRDTIASLQVSSL